MGYRDVIASAVYECEGGPDHCNKATTDKVLQQLHDAGYAVVPASLRESTIVALAEDYEHHNGTQSYRDIWSVALKSAQALA